MTSLINLYDLDMAENIPVSDAKRQLGALIERAQRTRLPIYLTRHGRPAVVLMDAQEFDRLLDLAEDAEDLEEAYQAEREMEESGAKHIPWEVVKAELGLV